MNNGRENRSMAAKKKALACPDASQMKVEGEPFCARLDEAIPELGLAHGSGSRLKTKRLHGGGVFGGKNPPKKEPRVKYCIKWLLMLYYECSRLNGLGSPFGFETSHLYRSR